VFLSTGVSALENLSDEGERALQLLLRLQFTSRFFYILGWIASSSANVFVSDHDTERVCLDSLLTFFFLFFQKLTRHYRMAKH
jgi:hypothetical protein